MADQSLATPEIALEPSRLARYSRQLALPGFDESTQLKLTNARVLVIGAGGLGSAAVPYLASTGVGTIGILDTDTVELSNLHRQIVHGVEDLGRSKLDSIADSVARIDPEIRVVKHNLRVDSSNVLELLSQYDLLVDGSDNFPTRYLASDAATISGKPLVWGAILQYGGQVGVSWSDRGPTYRDLFPVPPAPGDIPNCAEGGVLPGVCAVIGAIMSTEVVKILSGTGEPLIGRVCTYDALTGRFREIPFRADPAAERVTELIDYEAFCGIEKESAIVEELNPAELKELLDRGTELQLVDIREPFEREIVQIDNSDFIPLGQLPSRLSELRTDVPVVLYCHHGSRSARALRFLREQGLANATHLIGGIDAFAREIAPELQRY
ncbi:MAG: ThiF family adenylyltransferase [Microbacteriaceae bacterium]|nr:ThiF family adenylyltransferase [Microbacteriaceae bacterium]